MPVILLFIILFKSTKLLGETMKKIQTIEKWTRTITGILFMLTGIYYIIRVLI